MWLVKSTAVVWLLLFMGVVPSANEAWGLPVAHCNSCSDCATKLAGYDTVYLDNDLINVSGGCVTLASSASNKVFDCQGHKIDGDDTAIDPEYGVALFGGSSNTIRNCVVSDFSSGIYVWSSTGHAITGNTLRSNETGLELQWSDSNSISGNTSSDNSTGIYIANSNSNVINSNVICSNFVDDFKIASGSGNYGDLNTCDRPDGWNDLGTTGCTDICSGTVTCNSCSDCSSKLSGSFSKVMLTTNIYNHIGSCIYFYGDNTEFDCNGHLIDGDSAGSDYGIKMSSRSGNVVKNCVVTDFESGVYLLNSSGNTVTTTEARSNTARGFYLTGSSGNTISWSQASSNPWGIYLWSSSGNQLFFNSASSNSDGGIYLGASSSNSLAFNTASNNADAHAWGIYLYSSHSNNLTGNDLTGNYYGIKLDSSGSNAINNNRVCSAARNVDFDLTGGSAGNTGDNNRCCLPDGWNDAGTTGCTNPCDTEPDWDGDGVADACDCNDGFMGPNESGADCGGVCGTGCPNCVPVIKNGSSAGKVDIVFVPDTDYGGNMAQFRDDVLALIQNGYFGATEIAGKKCNFNFWYYGSPGDYQPICQRWTLPAGYRSDCSFADSTGIVFTGGGRACSSGVFSMPPGSTRTVVHETGHNIFGLADEYCCDGGYFEPARGPNIFRSNARCQASSVAPAGCSNFCPERKCSWPSNAACRIFASANGLNPDSCVGTCSPNWCNWRGQGFRNCCVDGGDGWWKSDANSCYMLSGSVFQPDCASNVNSMLNSLPACASSIAKGPSGIVAPGEDPTTKVLILDYNIKQDNITLRGAKIVYNFPPNHFKQHGDYLVKVLSSWGEELTSFFLDDPRAFTLANHKDFEPGMMMGDDIDFTVVTPFVDRMKRVEIVDLGTAEVVHTFSLSDLLREFCAKNPDDPQCQLVTAGVDHFLCYKAQTAKGTPKFGKILGVGLADQFGQRQFDLKKPVSLCNPADKNREGINDPETHLEGYQIKLSKTDPRQPKFEKRMLIEVTNQLGKIFVDTRKADRLLVPTAKSLTGPVAPPGQQSLDHYKCYKVKLSKGTGKFPRGIRVSLTDQFNDLQVYEVKQPSSLCMPVDKMGEGIKHPSTHLMCYRIRLSKRVCTVQAPKNALGLCRKEEDCGGTRGASAFCMRQVRYDKVAGINVNNQFGPELLDAVKDQELCVPSLVSISNGN